MPPARYFLGLSATKKAKRRTEIRRFAARNSTDPTAYVGFDTDRGIVTRPSRYTRKWNRRFPTAHSVEARARATGVPVRFLRECYRRGMAAWRTGHRPGATQQQWGYARVSSMLLCGKTYSTTDSDIVKKAIAASPSAAAWFRTTCHRT